MSETDKPETENLFQYFISTNTPFAVVTFVGEMNKEASELLNECEQKIQDISAKFYILYFRDVTGIAMESIPFLASLQQKLRAKGELRLCSLRPDVKDKLTKMGVVRGKELTDNLKATLLQLKEL